MTADGASFHDRRAVVVWGFALLWDAATALLLMIVRAEGGGWKGWLAFGVFALAGAGLSTFALRTPVLALAVRPSGLTISRRYPFRRRRAIVSLSEVQGATVVEDDDTDGGPFYVCRIDLQHGDPVSLSGTSSREAAEAEAARFNAAVETAGGVRRGPARGARR